MDLERIDGIKHAFQALSEKFGSGKSFEDVFELFGTFSDQSDVLFNVRKTEVFCCSALKSLNFF